MRQLCYTQTAMRSHSTDVAIMAAQGEVDMQPTRPGCGKCMKLAVSRAKLRQCAAVACANRHARVRACSKHCLPCSKAVHLTVVHRSSPARCARSVQQAVVQVCKAPDFFIIKSGGGYGLNKYPSS